MYKRILVPLEHTPTDEAIIEHVRKLARLCNSAVIFMHVADGWAARNLKQLDLRESEEMQKDRAYLEEIAGRFSDDGFDADALLASGDPSTEIAAAADREGCDLIAMSTHGHRLIGDLVYGSVANDVRHRSMVPVLLVRAPHVRGATPAHGTAIPKQQPKTS
jgi:nucleotide-binding universal stress UspA family protein